MGLILQSMTCDVIDLALLNFKAADFNVCVFLRCTIKSPPKLFWTKSWSKLLTEQKLVSWNGPEEAIAFGRNPWAKEILGRPMLDFRQITLFCFGNRLLKQKITLFSENWGAWPPRLPGHAYGLRPFTYLHMRLTVESFFNFLKSF